MTTLAGALLTALAVVATVVTADRWRDDPALFASEVLGVELWARQVEICKAAAKHTKVAVRSGQKIGKSRVAAVLALWWVYTRPRGRVIMTSAGDRQVRSVLWRELKKLVREAKRPLGHKRLNELPALGLQYEDGREILGFTAKDAEAMAGFSGDQLLYIVDEASGVPERIFEAIEGNLASGGHIILFSNPTQTSGTFFDAFHDAREIWHTIHISNWESPNVKAGRMIIQGLATRAWIDERLKAWGKDSPIYQVRVLGDFPTQSTDSVIALAHVEAARKRWTAKPKPEEEGKLELGVDVARFGDDDSTIAPVRGKRALPIISIHGYDSTEVAGAVAKYVIDNRRPTDGRVRVKIDCTGGYGAGVADQLRRLHQDKIEVVDIDVSESATNPEYHRLRDQLWFGLRNWLKDEGALPEDKRLEAELVAPRYGFEASGKIKVESKDEIKKRLKRSPDRADGLALAVYRAPVASVGKVGTKRREMASAGGGF